MRHGLLALLMSVLLAAPVHAQATAPEKFVDSVASQVLSIVKDAKTPIHDKKMKLRGLFTGVVDIPYVAKFVLGRHWRTATPAQQTAYLATYEPFLINNYVGRIAKYTGQTYKLGKGRADGDSYVVTMELLDPNGPSVFVDYRIRAEGAGYKVIDIAVEGVSLLTTQRSEFNSVVQNKGLDFLIQALEAKAKKAA